MKHQPINLSEYDIMWYIWLSPTAAIEMQKQERCVFAGEAKKLPHHWIKALGVGKRAFGLYEQYVSIFKQTNYGKESKENSQKEGQKGQQ